MTCATFSYHHLRLCFYILTYLKAYVEISEPSSLKAGGFHIEFAVTIDPPLWIEDFRYLADLCIRMVIVWIVKSEMHLCIFADNRERL